MEYGVHLFTFVPRIDAAALEVLPRVRDLGLQGVEIPLLAGRLDDLDPRRWRARLDGLGLFRVGSTGIPGELSTISDDPAVRREGIAFVERCIELTAELGADLLTGALYAPFGAGAAAAVGGGRTAGRRRRSVEALRQLCAFAAERGISLGLEPLNRYEHYLVNTAAEAVDLVREVGAPNLVVHLDTFHMNIEEKSFFAAVTEADGLLGHVHAAENDRGTPGTGGADWEGLFRGLAAVGYRGRMVVETFFEAIPDIADFTKVWRPLAPDPDTFCREGAAFLRGLAARYGL